MSWSSLLWDLGEASSFPIDPPLSHQAVLRISGRQTLSKPRKSAGVVMQNPCCFHCANWSNTSGDSVRLSVDSFTFLLRLLSSALLHQTCRLSWEKLANEVITVGRMPIEYYCFKKMDISPVWQQSGWFYLQTY